MQQNVIFLLLDIIGLGLLIKWCYLQVKIYRKLPNKTSFFNYKRFKFPLFILAIVGIPILLINTTDIENSLHISATKLQQNSHYYAIVLSFCISLVWLLYIYKIDVFEKEKKRYILLIIVLTSVLTLFAEVPYKFIHSIGFTNTKEPLQSFLYSVFGIGFIEETIKFIPLLIILKFTKAIDEPYDYIFYASASALGFAFIENALYLYSYGIDIINARALYATVAHMTFSSVIGYGLFLIVYKKTKLPAILVFLSMYVLAMLSHGFYDFWLINEAVAEYNGLTTLFFLATVHIWFVMKNNTLNSSNYYKKAIRIDNDRIKVFLIFSLLGLFMCSYVYVALVWDEEKANTFFIKSAFAYGYILLYLIATLSRFNLIQGLLKPIRLSLSFLFPKFK